MPRKVVVTGANGHVGANTVRCLLQNGYDVVPFVRKTSDLRTLAGLNLAYAFGDVRDKASLLEAAQGCDAIIHLAAVFRYWAPTVRQIIEPAVEGARNIFAVAAELGIKRVIYTSSTVAVGNSTKPKIYRNEQDWNENEHSPYGVAKTQSERIAWKLAKEYGIAMVALCPGAIIGRYDLHVTPSNRMLLDMLKGIGLTIVTDLPLVDVRDVAQIHVQALTEGVPGERYILTGKTLPMQELGHLVSQMTGYRIIHLPFGRSANILTGKMMEVVGNVIGWDPPSSAGAAREFSHRYGYYDTQRVKQTFQYTFYPLEETLRDTISWFSYLGMAKNSKRLSEKFPPDPEWLNLHPGKLMPA